MNRRELLVLVGGAAASPFAARAQGMGKVHRVALIMLTSPVSTMTGSEPSNPPVRAFVHALRDLGYVEGRNLLIERRSAEGRFELFGEIAAELVRLEVDVIVTVGNEMTREVARAAPDVPVVMAVSEEPVAFGLVASLARPGGLITGLTRDAGYEIEGKRLQLLKEAVPELSRVAYVGTRGNWESLGGLSIRAAASKLGITLIHIEHPATHYGEAFALIVRDRPDALFFARDALPFTNRQILADFALTERLPGAYPFRENVLAGGLMSYGVNVSELLRLAAGYVDKVLKGTKPAELPIEQPTKFELIINLKTAAALGLAIPPALLLSADEVVE
jgi:putative ABC transport system substrate-binding protein